MIAIIPIDDIEEHDKYSTVCKCLPKVVFENESMIIVHDAFDGRQEIEKLGVLSADNKGWQVFQPTENQ